MPFSLVATPIYIPTNSVEGFHFLHTLLLLLTFICRLIICRLFNDGRSDYGTSL